MNLFPSFVVDKRKFYAQNSTHLFLIIPNNTTGTLKRIVRGNSNSIQILLVGLCLGITLGIALIPLFESDCEPIHSVVQFLSDPVHSNNVFVGIHNFQGPQQSDAIMRPKMLRPRFYSTELGLRKNLVAGIILTDYTLLENLIAINKTLSPFVNQLLFFVVGQEASRQVRNLGVTGVVTLTSKRNESISSPKSKLDVVQYSQVGLKAIKYLGEKFVNNYNFFFLGLDLFYTNGVVLQEAVGHVSVSQDVFWGVNLNAGINRMCALDNGIVFSRSVIRKLSSRLDRCFVSSILKQGDSMKNCYKYSLGSIECFETLKTRMYLTVSTMDVRKFSSAVTIGPVTTASEMYWIQRIISETRANKIDEKIKNLSGIIDTMNLQIPEGYQTNSWPSGIPTHSRPKSRFDILKWKFFTKSKIYPLNDHITEKSLKGIEYMDVSFVINNSAIYLEKIRGQNADSFCFQYGYRRFDETRGMEYILDFQDSLGTLLRVESLRPISKVEIVPMPFVTEIRRVTIVIPVTSLDLHNETDAFLKSFFYSADKRSNSVVVIAIVVADGTLSAVDSIKLQNLKRMIASHNSEHNKASPSEVVDSIKVGHVIVNLKQLKASHYAFAIFDMLSNQILSSNTLVLALDLFVEIKDEFLNRVRMNTILNYQVFSPMPFVEYDPKLYDRDEFNKQFEIHKSTGYFDRESFNFISFYIGDYLRARKQFILSKQSAKLAPGSALTSTTENGIRHLSLLFLHESQLHFLRAPDPTLNVRFSSNLYQNCSQNMDCLRRKWGSKDELAKLILYSNPTESRVL